MLPVLMSDFRPPNIQGLKLWLDASRIQGLADGDAVTIWPDLMAPAAPFIDRFDRADSATVLGADWIALAGTWGIINGTAYVAAGTGTYDFAMKETGLSDCVVQVTFSTVISYQYLVLRCVDTNNFLVVAAKTTDPAAYGLYKRVNGAWTLLGSYAVLPANGDVIRAVLSGPSIKVSINGTERISVTDSTHQTATKHGMAQGASGNRWDSFVFARLTDAVQTTVASKPTFKVGIQNGRPVVRFNAATTQFMQTAGLAQALAQPNTVFVVASTANNNGYFLDGIAAGNRHAMLKNSGAWYMSAGTALTGYPGATVACVHAVLFNGAASSWVASGSQVLSGNAGTNPLTGLSLAVAYNISSALTGDIAEILVYNALLTTPQRRKVERYLAKKWGIPLVRQVVEDTFTRPDSATSLGNSETGQPWQAFSGTWGISNGQAYLVATGGSTHDVVAVDAGVSDGTVQATYNSGTDTGYWRLAFRVSDQNNMFFVRATGTGYELYRKAAGTAVLIASYVGTPAAGDTVRVVLSGSSITVFISGTSRITVTDTFNQTATKFGPSTVSGPSAARWDNFTVEV